MRDSFTFYHPIVNFIYFLVVMLVPMAFLHPVFLGISLFAAAAYTLMQLGIKKAAARLPLLFAVFAVSMCINPLFNHQGATILFYLKNGNPFTLESVQYGLAAGVMLMTVVLWFGCFHRVMTADKLMQLTGKILPSLSMLFTMTLRFVPSFMTQIQKVSQAQRCIGCDVTEGSLLQRIHHGMRILSITITWAFEHSIETADSMKSRGYGLRGTRRFVRHRFCRRDAILTAVILLLSSLMMGAVAAGSLKVRYYPVYVAAQSEVWSVLGWISYGILCILPVSLAVLEEIEWHYMISKI